MVVSGLVTEAGAGSDILLLPTVGRLQSCDPEIGAKIQTGTIKFIQGDTYFCRNFAFSIGWRQF